MSKHRTRLPTGNRSRQDGVVLMVALIILVALTLAGVALIRSVDTANVIAGNLAFHDSATHAGERGTERAIADWLVPNTAFGNTKLHADDKTNHAYLAARADPPVKDSGERDSWDKFWNDIPQAEKRLAAAGVDAPCPTDNSGADAAGNTVCYVIHRLCQAAGKPNTPVNPCTQPPPSTISGGSQSAGGIAPAASKPVYYRITTRIEGPRRTVSYVQTIVAI